MALVTSIDDFLELLRKCGLVSEQRLQDFLAEQPSLPRKPGKLASRCVRCGLLTDFQAKQLLVGKWRGFVLGGKYKLLELLGTGGMGQVFLCEHVLLRRPVALKILPADKNEDPAAIERFYREARAVAALEHPNIVRVHDIDRSGKLHMMVMEYVDGSSFQQIVESIGQLDITRAIHYVVQAAQGLDRANELGWVHRDMKPGNILLDRLGVVKVLDMGLARLFHDRADMVTKKYNLKNILGTADYLAPEQAVNSDVDIRADLYSLGGTFYFILAGKPPFPTGTVSQKLIWHQVRQPTPIQALRPEVPAGIAAIITKMMAKNPADRYQTPREVIDALTPFLPDALPPPAAAEMPRLSPATEQLLQACGLSGAPSGSSQVLPAARKIIPVIAAAGQSPPPVIVEQATTSDPSQATPKPIAVMQLPPPNGMMDTKTQGSSEIYLPPVDVSSSDTVAVLPPNEPRQWWSRLAVQRQLWQQWKLPVRRIVAVAAAVLILAAGMSIMGLALSSMLGSRPAPTQPSIDRSQLRIVAVPRSEVEFATLDQALNKARPGTRILVQVPQIEESLVLFGERGRGVTIEADPAVAPVKWKPAAPEQPILRIQDVSNFCLKGFALDGQTRVDDGIEIIGGCPNLRLESLHISGFRKSGVAMSRCDVDFKEAMFFRELVFEAAAGEGRPSALVFRETPDDFNNFLYVQDCVFKGPFRQAVSIGGATLFLDFCRNRFYNCDAAFACQVSPAKHRLSLTVTSNTFAKGQAVLQLQPLPPLEEGIRVTLKNNLLVETAAFVTSSQPIDAQLKRLFPTVEGNVRDAGSCQSADDIAALRPTLLTFEPLPQEGNVLTEFLRFDRKSVLMTAGPGQSPVGVPPTSGQR